MILGEDLLPSSTLSTTSTICELKYGKKPRIVAHCKDSCTETREPMSLELVTDGEKTYQEQINEFVSVKSDREKAPYKKVELFWPHPLFKVISNGIGMVTCIKNSYCVIVRVTDISTT